MVLLQRLQLSLKLETGRLDPLARPPEKQKSIVHQAFLKEKTPSCTKLARAISSGSAAMTKIAAFPCKC